MSSFVVESKTINRIVGFIKQEADRKTWWADQKARHAITETKFSIEDPANLGLAMYNLNLKATGQRYQEIDPNNLPGCYEAGKLSPYRFGLDPKSLGTNQISLSTMTGAVDQLQAFKSLHCWLYQCSEGDVPETPLYKAFRDISNHWAQHIVASLPAYDKADWE
jgi:hypothetical protein